MKRKGKGKERKRKGKTENEKQISTEMSQKELVKKRTEYDFCVPKMRFAYGNDTKIKRRPRRANIKKIKRRATRQ